MARGQLDLETLGTVIYSGIILGKYIPICLIAGFNGYKYGVHPTTAYRSRFVICGVHDIPNGMQWLSLCRKIIPRERHKIGLYQTMPEQNTIKAIHVHILWCFMRTDAVITHQMNIMLLS